MIIIFKPFTHSCSIVICNYYAQNSWQTPLSTYTRVLDLAFYFLLYLIAVRPLQAGALVQNTPLATGLKANSIIAKNSK